MQEIVRHGCCPTRKLSDKTQPNDTRICRRTSVSDKFRVGQIPCRTKSAFRSDQEKPLVLCVDLLMSSRYSIWKSILRWDTVYHDSMYLDKIKYYGIQMQCLHTRKISSTHRLLLRTSTYILPRTGRKDILRMRTFLVLIWVLGRFSWLRSASAPYLNNLE